MGDKYVCGAVKPEPGTLVVSLRREGIGDDCDRWELMLNEKRDVMQDARRARASVGQCGDDMRASSQ